MQEYPTAVARFLQAFHGHAQRLAKEDPGGRNADTAARIEKQILAPWERSSLRAQETRQTAFLRDYHNVFLETVHACEHLDTVVTLIDASLRSVPRKSIVKAIIYWSEAYLNEVYIFQLRMVNFLVLTERKYKKDSDFAEAIVEICGQARQAVLDALKPLVKIRGMHVHEERQRHLDPQLVRLSHLELIVVGLGADELVAERDQAIVEAEEWLRNQAEYCARTSWVLLDGVCEVLAKGIVTDNGWLIVPTNYKDSPIAS